jgi:hypothetical protein
MREIVSGGSTLGAILVGPPGVLRRSLRMKAPQAGISGALEGRQSLGALSALRPAARLDTPASSLSDEMPIGLEKGIVMTMLRNAGSLKNDKKNNMREIVIDTETTGLAPLRLKQSMRQEHQPTSSYQRCTIRVTTAAVSAESANMSRWLSSMIKVERVSRMARALAMARAKRSRAGHHDLGEGDGRMKARYILINMTKFIRVEGARNPIFGSHAPSGPRKHCG